MANSNIELEFHQIKAEEEIILLLNEIRRKSGLDKIQLRAAASSLHSIYNGIERILFIILKGKRIIVSQNSRWHLELLEKTAEAELLPEEIIEILKEYMGFWHFFRHSYGFMIDEELIAPLMDNVSTLLMELKTRLID